MELTLVVRSGDEAGKRIPVPSGGPRLVGRQAPADVRVADDPMLSNQHFSVLCDGDVCLLKDLGSRFGTEVNGRRVTEAALRDGDEIRAGRTVFGVQLLGDVRATPTHTADPAGDTPGPAERAAPVARSLPVVDEFPPAALSDIHRNVLAYLRTQANLYAVLDAAREPTVIARLKASGEEHASLYDGEQGEELSAFGPWLVKLPPDKPLLEQLVRDGWGKSWGVYLTCRLPFKEVRRHLRQFLLAKLPDGRQVCFRYYDPRVLRTYFPTCTAAEAAAFVGPIDRYLVESADDAELSEFAANYRDWKKVGLLE
jgi:pSer/pThr/pTyr-binding forkhead associated (FHA) protein